jgi:alkylation response protein AidB-like acyl-CoA dehydrogenase
VVTPAAFKPVHRAYIDGGWLGLDLPRECGGQGLPWSVQTAFSEMVSGACVAFGMLPINCRAAAWLLHEYADPELAQRVLGDLMDGSATATIAISEAQAGSDVGRIVTRAEQGPHGDYRVSGSKIFISYGDHDLSAQNLHMTLARTVDAPPGPGGLSLFMVPAITFDSGERNGVSVSRVERKMGLKGSPTCVLDLDAAVAYRLGEEHQGLKAMFTMMNIMRLEVAVQGVAIAGAATHAALRYALERPQGGDARFDATPIVEHADVRRMLLCMRARTEAMRALVYQTAMLLDCARAGEEGSDRKRALHLAEFLLPVCKACAADTAFEVANLAVQVFGGHGYVADAGVEQYVRDARVLSIYEGTNGIQALDLVTRKLVRDGGKRYRLLSAAIRGDLERYSDLRELSIHGAVVTGLAELDELSEHLLGAADEQAFKVRALALDYLQLVGLVAGAWMWLRMAAAAAGDSIAHRQKRAGAAFYATWIMTEAATRTARIRGDAAVVEQTSVEVLTAGVP